MFSSTPLSLADSLAIPSESLVRLQPLFSIGIHDIPLLEQLALPHTTSSRTPSNANTAIDDEEDGQENNSEITGWIACTTDEIIGMKSKLYDIVVEMPSSHLGHPSGKKQPILKNSGDNKEIKATQRDLRRYRALRRALRPLRNLSTSSDDRRNSAHSEEHRPLLLRSLTNIGEEEENEHEDGRVESSTWSELAYSSFLWWATAGEKDDSLLEEESLDLGLLGSVSELARHMADEKRYKDEDDTNSSRADASSSSSASESRRKDARLEMEMISYFHQLSKSIFDVCSEVLTREDNQEEEQGFDEPGVRVDGEAVKAMGLDVWSPSDKEFITSFCELWYQRQVHVDPLGVECCGVRIC